MKNNNIILYAIIAFLIICCSTQTEKIKKSDIYFSKALEFFEDEKYSKAKSYFQNIIDEYAGTEMAIDALYYLAFCEYELKDFSNAKQSFKIYNRYSQDILKIQSARFMICRCMFDLTLDYSKDQSDTYSALEEFQLFIEEYPSSKYEDEASEKIELLRNKLALKKYDVAKLYIKSDKFDSARLYINQLLKEYYDTPYSDDAHIANIIMLLMENKSSQAEGYLNKNKDKFHSDQKYDEAQNIISNSNKRLKIKKIYFLDYINKIL